MQTILQQSLQQQQHAPTLLITVSIWQECQCKLWSYEIDILPLLFYRQYQYLSTEVNNNSLLDIYLYSCILQNKHQLKFIYRLDFTKLVLSSTSGAVTSNYLTVSGPTDLDPPSISGTNTGYHSKSPDHWLFSILEPTLQILWYFI